MNVLKWIAVVVVVAALPGCELAALEGASVVGTDKTVGDHIVSFISKKDCSTYRKNTSPSGVYCKQDEVQPTPTVHCYQTLGSVVCYAKPVKDRAELGRDAQNVDPDAGAYDPNANNSNASDANGGQ